MLLSKSCEYAIRAGIYIAYRSSKNEKAGIPEISEAIGSPIPFTAKVLQIMSRKHVITSCRGPHGGFFMEDPSAVYLVDIVRAIDGDRLFTSCVMGLGTCSDTKPCPMHHQIKPIRQQLFTEFSNKSVLSAFLEEEQQKCFLK